MACSFGVAWRGVAWRGVAWRGVAWRGVAWRGVAWWILLSGCARPDWESDEAVAKLLPGSGPETSTREGTGLEYDFGPVLAHGQTLRHDFALKNRSTRPLRVLGAMAMTPCCSSVGEVPGTIPPGGEVRVPVSLRVGTQFGRRGFQFVVRTDSAERPAYRLTLLVDLMPEVEVAAIGEAGLSGPLGQPGAQRFRVVGRRLGPEGRAAPTAVDASPPLAVKFVGPPIESRRSGGLVESSREVEVARPAASEPGKHGGELIFRWDGEITWRHALAWEVPPSLKVSPPGLALRADGGLAECSILVRSSDAPFRIVGVSGECLAEPVKVPGDGPSRLRSLRLVIDPAKATKATSDIRITTDHPRQPAVVVGVVLMPPQEKEAER